MRENRDAPLGGPGRMVGLSVIMQRGKSGFLIYERTVGRDGFFQDNLGFGVRIEF